MAVAGAAGITQLSPQPTQAVLNQGDRLLPLRCGQGRSRGVTAVEKLHQSSSKLFSGAPLRLAFESMPIAVADAEQPVQRFGRLLASFRPWLRD